MKSVRRSLKHRAEAAGIELAVKALSVLPESLCEKTGSLIGQLAWYAVPRWRRRSLENIRSIFPEWASDERLALARRNFAELGQNVVDWVRLRNSHGALALSIDIVGIEHLVQALETGRGAVLVTGHYGLWELIPRVVQRELPGALLCVVGRTLRNPFLFQRVLGARLGPGCVHLPQGLFQIAPLLRRGAAVGMLVDQHTPARRGGVLVPFMGREAWTSGGPAALALRTGAAIVPVHASRRPDGNHRVDVGPPLKVTRSGSFGRDVVCVTAAITEWLEGIVQAHPEQWVWFHRRWRVTKPSTRRGRPIGRS